MFALGELTLDLAQSRLLSAKGEVALRPKAMRLLSVLAQSEGRVVSKDELMGEVWPDVIVTEDSLTQCVHEVREALGPQAAPLLKTVPRRGYMLTGLALGAMLAPDAGEAVAPGTIAVMPFVLPDSIDPHMRILFDGLTHDIISNLARLRAYRVTGRGSVFALRPFAEDALRLRHLLNVDTVVSGRVLPGGAKASFRVVLDVVRTRDGSIDWSEEVQIPTADLHHSAPWIAQRLVNVISRAVTEGGVRAALSGALDGQDAWEAFHLGLNTAFAFSQDGMREAMGHLSRATALDPGFARAHAYMSFCQYHLAFTNRLGDRRQGASVALASATKALEADALSPVGHWAYGRALWLGGDPEAGLRHIGEAISLCPSFPNAHYMLGFLECHVGDPARALDSLQHSENLSPFDPFLAAIQITRAIAHLRLGDTEAAAYWAGRSTVHRSAYGHMLANAALILQATGKDSDAQRVMAKLLLREPDYDPENLFATLYSLPTDIARTFRRGLQSLGR